jgi:hypothetical protein
MESLVKIKEYLQHNKEWLFSGIGVLVFSILYTALRGLFKTKQKQIKYIETTTSQIVGKEKVTLYTPRAEFDDYLTFLVNQAKKEITLVSITFGFVSYPKIENLVENNNVVFHFYILNLNSQHYHHRVQDIHLDTSKANYFFKQDIENLLKLKEKFPNKVYLYQYDTYPFWHYVCIDENKIFLSYHPIGDLGYKSSDVFEVEKKLSLHTFKLFKSHIELIQKESQKL